MAERIKAWWPEPWLLLEAFALVNLGFLTVDIYLAHSFNEFRKWPEYVPLYFSAVAPLILGIGLALRARHVAVWRNLGYVVGWGAVIMGLAGVILHLNSLFFYERTLKSLTYSAPFIAPLAYTGLGFLLVMNRMVDSQSKEWAEWALFFALGGFVGNFGLTLSDHAENGFFYRTEWVGVWAERCRCRVSGSASAATGVAKIHSALWHDSSRGSGSGPLGIRAACHRESPWPVDACPEEFHIRCGTVCAAAIPQPGSIRDDRVVETVDGHPRVVRGAHRETTVAWDLWRERQKARVNRLRSGVGRFGIGQDIRKEESVALYDFAVLDGNQLKEHGPSVGEGVKLAILAARINRGWQTTQ